MGNSPFHPVIFLPPDYEVYDFSQGYDPNRSLKSPFGIGRYDEKRLGMYTETLFTKGNEPRNIHVGIDIGAPVGTPVHAFEEGEIFLFGYNDAPGDYGNTVITRHLVNGEALFALHGHLSRRSLEGKVKGARFEKGSILAWIGDKHENGGWNPHLHFQLCRREPEVCDMPGVVTESSRQESLWLYPDPRMVLGPLY